MQPHYNPIIRIIAFITLSAFLVVQVAWGYEKKGTVPDFGDCPLFLGRPSNIRAQAAPQLRSGQAGESKAAGEIAAALGNNPVSATGSAPGSANAAATDTSTFSYHDAIKALDTVDQILTYEILKKPAEVVMELLNEASRLLDSAEAFQGSLYDFGVGDRKTEIPFLRQRIAEHKKAIEFELRVKAAAQTHNRPFLDINEFLAPNFEKDEPLNLIGHATNFEVLYKIVFESNGVVISGKSPIFVNFGGRGQAARVRINCSPGLVSIVWDRDKLVKAGIVLMNNYGEVTINQPTPLSFTTPRSKCHIWQILLSILDARNEVLTVDKKTRIATALGYDNYYDMKKSLTPELSAVFAVSAAARASGEAAADATGQEQAEEARQRQLENGLIETAKQIAPRKTALVIGADGDVKEAWVKFLKYEMYIGKVDTAVSQEEADKYGARDITINLLNPNNGYIQSILGIQQDITGVDPANPDSQHRAMLAVAECL